MARYFGIDNGPCYASEAFTKIMQEYNVKHITSSPHYSQSNGLGRKVCSDCERMCFTKLEKKGQNLFKALMIYRNTPLASNLQSPMADASKQDCLFTIANAKCSKETAWIANRNA